MRTRLLFAFVVLVGCEGRMGGGLDAGALLDAPIALDARSDGRVSSSDSGAIGRDDGGRDGGFVAPPHDVLGDAIAALPRGEWREVEEAAARVFGADRDGYSKLQYANRIAWDPERNRLMYVGGGHGSNSEFIVYDEATNTWSVMFGDSPGAPPIPPPFPSSSFSHSYEQNTFVPDRGLFVTKLPMYDSSDRLFLFDTATDTWTQSSPMPDVPSCCGSLDYVADLARVIYSDGGGIVLYDAVADRWERVPGGVDLGDGYETVGAYSPVSRVYVLGGRPYGGSGNRNVYRMSLDRRVEAIAPSPVDLGTLLGFFVPNPLFGTFFVFSEGGAYELDAVAETWTPADDPPWTRGAIGESVAVTIHEYGVILVLVQDEYPLARVWLYRP